MKMVLISLLPLALILGCASTPPPPPEQPPAAAPVSTPPPGAPAPATGGEPAPDPSKPPPEVQAGCLPECAMVHGKCQALVDSGPTFDGEEETEEIGPGPKRSVRKQIVKPCESRCCRGQD